MGRTRWARLLVMAVVVFTTARAQGQAPSPPADPPKTTGLIIGQVVDALSGQPIPNAVVSMFATPAPGVVVEVLGFGNAGNRRILTDNQGQFLFRSLAKGIYQISATGPGYGNAGYGARRPGGSAQPFMLEDDQHVGDVKIRLWKNTSLGGTLLDEIGEPMVGVGVQVSRRQLVGGRLQTLSFSTSRTDDRGVFRFSGLQPGEYLVGVPSTVTSVPVGVADAWDQAMATANGSITNSDIYKALSASRGPTGTTSGVRVGDSILSISSGRLQPTPPLPAAGGKILGYPTTYYPNAMTSSQATVITLKAGEDRTNVDMQMRLVTMTRVAGTLMGPQGPEANFGVRLVPASSGSDGLPDTDVASTATDTNGAFTFVAVPVGQYLLRAAKVPTAPRSMSSGAVTMISTGTSVIGMVGPTGPGVLAPLPTEPTLWAEMPISVGETGLSGVSVQLRTGLTVSGHLEFEGSAEKPAADKLQGINIMLSSSDPRSLSVFPSSRVAPNAQFNTQGYPAGKYWLTASPPAGWFPKSATFGGRNVLQTPLDLAGDDISGLVITFTDKPTQLSGHVHDATGKVDPAALVIVIPADYQSWIANGMRGTSRTARPSQTGSFQITSMLPGDYLVAAVNDDAAVQWQDAKFIQGLVGFATPVTLTPGSPATVDLKTGQVK